MLYPAGCLIVCRTRTGDDWHWIRDDLRTTRDHPVECSTELNVASRTAQAGPVISRSGRDRPTVILTGSFFFHPQFSVVVEGELLSARRAPIRPIPGLPKRESRALHE